MTDRVSRSQLSLLPMIGSSLDVSEISAIVRVHTGSDHETCEAVARDILEESQRVFAQKSKEDGQ